MNYSWNTEIIGSKYLIEIAKRDPKEALSYLHQFVELIPERIENIRQNILLKNRREVKQLLHQLIPQLQFFEIYEVIPAIRYLEKEHLSISWDELVLLLDGILCTLDCACKEVQNILDSQ